MSNDSVRRAVHTALASTAAIVAAQSQVAVAQDSAADGLEEVIVTGTRIRRVDAETASPVLTVDRDAIANSGATSLGDLLQSLPAIAGAATNPSVNNGGGTGESNIELRGLGAERTLVLLNGRRLGFNDYITRAIDINALPVNMIERVDVLKEGAGAIYGSDAVAGVVNFITRKAEDGAEVGVDYGVSSEDDGERQAISLSLGAVGDRGNVLLGLNWNKQDSISAADREFSRNALYLYGSVFEGGSSRAPTGRIFFDAGSALATQFGCGSVTRVAGAAGSTTADYRCFVTSGANADFYNYQLENLILTPQERGNVFALGEYQVTENVTAFAEFMYNRTTSGFKIAELPFDARSDRVVIPANNVFNPFGIDFGGQPDQTGGTLNPNLLVRLQALGNRRNDNSTNVSQVNLGLKGPIGDSSWQWDVYAGYGRQERSTETSGYLFKPSVAAAFGPNFINGQGVVTCGTPTAPIAECTPVNIFNLDAPGQAAALGTITASYNQNQVSTTKLAQANANGTLFSLPAGDVQLAIGANYAEYFTLFNTDANTQALPPLFNSCQLSGETCSADASGEYDVSELYAEVFVPVLKDAPGAQALNLIAGIRYSDYSTFGDTTNATFKVEYRPISDLLVRASYSEVFRAPQVIDLFRGPTATASQFNDPCVGLTSAALAATPNLALVCQNVAPDTGFAQPNSQVDGLFIGNPALNPETGDVLTWGLVYEPSALRGLSLSVDVWKYSLEDVITSLDTNFIADQCLATGNAAFCSLINRFPDGTILQIQQPTFNLGSLDTDGVDVNVAYRLNTDSIGDFRFAVNATKINSYESVGAPGAPAQEIVGTYDRQFGNYAELRGGASVAWSMGPFEAMLTARYIDGIRLTDPDGAPGIQPDLQIPSLTYTDLMLGYTWKENTKIQVGIDNLTDKQPPIMYQNNVLNANTDVNTYDTVGRYMWAKIVHKFN